MTDSAINQDLTDPLGQATDPGTTSLPRPPPMPAYIANNLVYTLHYNVDRSSSDTLTKIIREHFNDEDIKLAFSVSSDFIPEIQGPKFRNCTVSSPTKQLSLLISWLQTSSPLPQIFAPHPYSLPPPDIKDLSSVTAYNTAKKSLKTSNALEATLNEKIVKLSDQMEMITDSLHTIECRLPPPPVPDIPPPGSSPSVRAKNTYAGRVSPASTPLRGGADRPSATHSHIPSGRETIQRAVQASPQVSPLDVNVPIVSESHDTEAGSVGDVGLETGMAERWRTDGHSDRDRRKQKRIHKEMHRPTTQERTPVHQKRCHKVVYNLPSTVSEGDIKNHVMYITGSEPIITQRLPCKNKSKSAFRITCLFEHVDKLTADKFGAYIKVSRYNLARDHLIGRLNIIPPAYSGLSQTAVTQDRTPEASPYPPPANENSTETEEESNVAFPPPIRMDRSDTDRLVTQYRNLS